MQPRNLILVIALIVLSHGLTACSNSSKAKDSVDQVQRNLDQTMHNLDNEAEKAKQESEEAQKNGNDVLKKTQQDLLDATAMGGQPGPILLQGSFVEELKSSHPNVSIRSQSGMGWRGQLAPLKDPTSVDEKISDAKKEKIAELRKNETFINIGCDASEVAKTLLEKTLSPANARGEQVIEAHTVLICDVRLLTGQSLDISAATLVLHEVSFDVLGNLSRMIVITAGDWILEGINKISTIGSPATMTLLPGPLLLFAAENFGGTGSLEIQAQGANYQSEKTP